MKARPFLLLAFVTFALLSLLGCNSPRAQWAVARQSLTTLERTSTAANQSGLLPDRDFVATESYVHAAQKGLSEADAELLANGDQPTPRFRFYLNLANTTLRSLAPAAGKLSASKPPK